MHTRYLWVWLCYWSKLLDERNKCCNCYCKHMWDKNNKRMERCPCRRIEFHSFGYCLLAVLYFLLSSTVCFQLEEFTFVVLVYQCVCVLILRIRYAAINFNRFRTSPLCHTDWLITARRGVLWAVASIKTVRWLRSFTCDFSAMDVGLVWWFGAREFQYLCYVQCSKVKLWWDVDRWSLGRCMIFEGSPEI